MRRHGDSKTTADVAVTGKARPLDLSDKDREQGRITDAVINPPEREYNNLRNSDKHD